MKTPANVNTHAKRALALLLALCMLLSAAPLAGIDFSAFSVKSHAAATDFVWGQDNWSFANSSQAFSGSTYRDQISQSYQEVLANNLNAAEYELVFGSNTTTGRIDNVWVGCSYGMPVLTILAKNGFLDYSAYTNGATCLHDLEMPKGNANVSSLINYYHFLQYKDVIQSQYRTVPNRTNEANIKDIISNIDRNGFTLVAFAQSNFGGHAIVAYDYEYGSFSYQGTTYNGCIKIYDCNMPQYNADYNIYFNTNSYKWTIPAYASRGIDSSKDAKFYAILSDVETLNAGGYLSFMLGDISGDGDVTAEDARLAHRASVGLEEFAAGTREFLAADVDKNGRLTSGDARQILRTAIGLQTLPGTEDERESLGQYQNSGPALLAYADTDEEGYVTLSLQLMNAQGLTHLDYEIAYDDDALTFVKATNGNIAKEIRYSQTFNGLTAGTVRGGFYLHQNALEGDYFELAELRFRVNDTAGSSTRISANVLSSGGKALYSSANTIQLPGKSNGSIALSADVSTPGYVMLTVRLKDAVGLTSTSFTIDYDPTAFTYSDHTFNTKAGSGVTAVLNTYEDGQLAIGAMWNEHLTESNFALGTIKLKVNDNAPASSVLSVTPLESTGVQLTAGNITVTPRNISTYTVSYDANGGTGAPEAQNKKHDIGLTLSGTKPTKAIKLTYDANGGSVSAASKTVAATFKSWNTAVNGSGGSYAPGGAYTANASVTLYAQWANPKAGDLATPTRSGYTFAGWFTAATGGTQVTKDSTVTKSQTLYAHWNKISTYAVTYNANGGTGAPANQTKTHGTALTLSGTKPTKSHTLTYDANGGSVSVASKSVSTSFNSWNTKQDGTGTSYAPGATYSSDANVTLYAQWTNQKAGDLATPTRSGYTFAGWYTASGNTKITKDTTITESQTIYAQWTPVQYAVTYNANGGTGAPANQTKTHGTALTLSGTKPTKSHTLTYDANGGSVSVASKSVSTSFNSWNTKQDGTGTSYAPGATYSSDTNVTLYVQWTNQKAGDLATPTRSGYTFAGWYTASGNTKITKDTTITKSQTIYAHWTPIQYTVTYNANGGTGAPANQTKTHGTALTLSGTKPTKAIKLTYDANGGSVSAASKTVAATFKSWNTAVNGSGGSYAPGGAYTANASVTLYAQWTNPKAGDLATPTRSGYTFAGWFTAASGGTQVTKDSTVTKSQTLYAHWTKLSTYTVTYNANGGTGAPAAQTKTQGKALTLSSAKPTKTYKLTYNVNGGNLSTAGKTVGATFKSWNTKADGKGTTYAPGGSYTANASVTLYAQWTNPKAGDLATPTRSGYTFAGWYTAASGGTKVTKDSTVTKSQTLYAHWTKLSTYTVTYNANGGTGAPAAQTKTQGKALTLSSAKPTKTIKITYDANGGKVSPATKSYTATFKNWNTKADGKGTSYAPGAAYKADAALTLYAQWTNPKAGALAVPTRAGYTFQGWYTEKTGGGRVATETIFTKSQTLYARWSRVSDFTWGKDNWNFINDDVTGDFPSTPYRSQIGETYSAALQTNLSNCEYQTIFGVNGKGNGKLDRDWVGSCYGMSALVVLSKQGMIPFADYKAGATTLHDLGIPKKDAKLNSLITYYHMLQYRDVIQQQYRTTPYRSGKENINEIISLIDKNGMALISYAQADFGHAVVAYDYEYNSFTFNGVTYQGCIKVWDPDASTAYNKNCNIYFNTNSYNWAIPQHGVASVRDAKFYYIGSDPAALNAGGYHAGTKSAAYKNFVARLNAPELSSDSRSVSKIKKNADGDYITISSTMGDIIEDNAYDFGASKNATFGYNLNDAASAYQVSQGSALPLSTAMDFETCDLTATSAAGLSASFAPGGFVQVEGESAAYTLGMTFDKDYPTRWFHVEVAGDGANEATLEKAKDGYVLTADNLKNTTVTVSDRETSITLTFSASCPGVLIYEIDKNTVGIKGDADGDGKFDKVLAQQKADGSAEVIPGDVNSDGDVTSEDARYALRAAVGLDDTAEGLDFSNKTNRCYIAADVDGEAGISAGDARLILRAAVGLEKLS